MPIPLGILAAAGFRPSAGETFQLLESTTLTSSQASVEFTNLATKYASTYKHLQIRFLARSSNSGVNNDGLWMRFNADTGNNYAWHRLEGNGSNVLSGAGTSTNWMLMGVAPRSGSTANAFSAGVIEILDPFVTSKNTTARSLNGQQGATPAGIFLNSGFWNNTAAVTSTTLLPDAAQNFVAGSRFSLYGLRS